MANGAFASAYACFTALLITLGETLKKMHVLMALAVLALAGCGAGAPPNSAPASLVATSFSPSVTPSPTPSAMSVAEAAKYYLAAVCPTNILGKKASDTVQAEPFDLQAAKADVAALRDGYRKTIETLSDGKVMWPETVKADVATLVDDTYKNLSGAENVANQTTEANFLAAWNNWETPPNATAQKIRVKLALPSDTSSSCTPS